MKLNQELMEIANIALIKLWWSLKKLNKININSKKMKLNKNNIQKEMVYIINRKDLKKSYWIL